MTALPTPPLLTTDEAAAFLQMNKSWLEHARLDGNGPNVTRIGRIVRYRQQDLDAFVESNRETKSNSM